LGNNKNKLRRDFNMDFKEKLRTIYYFLNNTTGQITEEQLKYLVDWYISAYDIRVYDKDIDRYKKINLVDLYILNEYLENGEKDDEFIDYIINWGSKNAF
jgi:hypothetical protein